LTIEHIEKNKKAKKDCCSAQESRSLNGGEYRDRGTFIYVLQERNTVINATQEGSILFFPH